MSKKTKKSSKEQGKALNRIRVVMAEQNRTNLWLASELGVTSSTVSKWCTNSMQPSLETFFLIAETLEVGVHSLLENYRR